MFKASSFFTQLPSKERKNMLTLLRQLRTAMRFEMDQEAVSNVKELMTQLEHDHNDQSRIERTEKENQPVV